MSSNYRTFKFTADTIDGKIQEFPPVFYLRCDQVKPIGRQTVREYNGNECIVAMNVFLVMYNGQLLGNKCYKTFQDFMQFLKAKCFSNYLQINGCNMTLNGCSVSI